MKLELQEWVIDFLIGAGIKAEVIGDSVAVNRDSMCNSWYAGIISEESAYQNVLKELNRLYPICSGSACRLFWSGKTDDVLFLGDL